MAGPYDCTTQPIETIVDDVDARLNVLEAHDIAALQTAVTALQGDVSTLQSGLADLEARLVAAAGALNPS
mgnify:CR=1 FL=1|jgi:ABC-type transporter Mla subunit MlaD